MVFLHEEHGVGYEEAPHFVLFKVKEGGTPLGLLAPARIRVLIKGSAVEKPQALLIPAEVSGHPVHYHAQPRLMALVYEFLELRRVAVAGGDGIISGNLIAPAVVQRVLGYRQQLYMGIAHLLYIAYKPPGQRRKVQPLYP